MRAPPERVGSGDETISWLDKMAALSTMCDQPPLRGEECLWLLFMLTYQAPCSGLPHGDEMSP